MVFHISTIFDRNVLLRCLFTINKGYLIDWKHLYNISTPRHYFKLKVVYYLGLFIAQCIICIMGKIFEPLHGGETGRNRVSYVAKLKYYIANTILTIFGPTFKYHNTYACYKQTLVYGISRPFWSNPTYLERQATYTLSTSSTISPRPGSMLIWTTLIVQYVEVIGFE